jgi:predicted RNase H-like HicB family nuclease
VVIRSSEDGYFLAEVPIIPGCISQCKIEEEALTNIKEAVVLCLECQKEEGWTIPKKYFIEQIEVVV